MSVMLSAEMQRLVLIVLHNCWKDLKKERSIWEQFSVEDSYALEFYEEFVFENELPEQYWSDGDDHKTRDKVFIHPENFKKLDPRDRLQPIWVGESGSYDCSKFIHNGKAIWDITPPSVMNKQYMHKLAFYTRMLAGYLSNDKGERMEVINHLHDALNIVRSGILPDIKADSIVRRIETLIKEVETRYTEQDTA